MLPSQGTSHGQRVSRISQGSGFTVSSTHPRNYQNWEQLNAAMDRSRVTSSTLYQQLNNTQQGLVEDEEGHRDILSVPTVPARGSGPGDDGALSSFDTIVMWNEIVRNAHGAEMKNVQQMLLNKQIIALRDKIALERSGKFSPIL